MKLNIKKILVPTDFSETGMLAIDHAANLARLAKADLILVHVLPVNPYYYEIPEPIMLMNNQEELHKMVREKLQETVEKMHIGDGIKARAITARGRVAHEVMLIAQEEKADLIVMGTHGAKGFEELFIGSNAHKIVNIAPCPVITIQTHAKKLGFSNIVLPIDRSAHSREKVEAAIHLAKIYDGKLHILGLLEDMEEGEYEKLQVVLDQVQHSIEKAGISFTRHTVKGDHIALEALKYGNKVNADLIIIMTEHESKLTGIFMGPFAKQIVNHSRIPVMSIKPHYGTFEALDLTGGYSIY
jgi:nucleotide-binding universal stress UspA family protein